MKEFQIALHSFQEVREFISLATVQPFSVMVGNDIQTVNGKSFIGMVSLDFRRPVKVICDCDDAALENFSQQVRRILAN